MCDQSEIPYNHSNGENLRLLQGKLNGMTMYTMIRQMFKANKLLSYKIHPIPELCEEDPDHRILPGRDEK